MPWTPATDGFEIYYEDRGSGPVVVFVSGYMGITDIWQHQIDALSDQYRTIALDNRGYGRSAKPESPDAYSIEQHAADLRAVLDAAGVDTPAVLIAHSMGGFTASAFTLANPERVAGIVYAGTQVSAGQMRGLGMSVESLMDGVATPSAAVEFYKAFGLTERIALEAAQWPLHALRGNAEALMRYDIAKEYTDITVPALILHGDSDIPTPLDPCGYGLKEALPNARLEILEGVNHFPQVEAPEKATSLIEEHVRHCFG